MKLLKQLAFEPKALFTLLFEEYSAEQIKTVDYNNLDHKIQIEVSSMTFNFLYLDFL